MVQRLWPMPRARATLLSEQSIAQAINSGEALAVRGLEEVAFECMNDASLDRLIPCRDFDGTVAPAFAFETAHLCSRSGDGRVSAHPRFVGVPYPLQRAVGVLGVLTRQPPL